jgi:flagellar biosynthesis chaperone FliJ
MATALEQIFDLKQRKEEKAQTAATAARLALEQAARIVEQRRREAEAYSRALLVQQAGLYDGLEGQLVHRTDIDEVREEIARMRAHEAALYEQAKAAEVARQKAAETLEAARRAHLQAIKKVEKFHLLVDLEQAESAALAQAAEDASMDEFIRLGEPADV